MKTIPDSDLSIRPTERRTLNASRSRFIRRLGLFAFLWAALVLLGLSAQATLVTDYWPMCHGDVKYYRGKLDGQTVQMRVRFFELNLYTPRRFEMIVEVYDPEYGYWDENARAIVGYSADQRTLFEYGMEMGWITATWNPAVATLTEDSLASGGARSFQSTVRVQSINIPVSGTITTKSAATVAVPAGTYNQCRSLAVKATGTYEGQSLTAAAQAFVLAPRVGQIKIAVVNERGAVLSWFELTGGTVCGRDVADFANQVPPTLGITTPAAKAIVTNALVAVAGTARDNAAVTGVFYQLNTGNWQLAPTSNGWTNWTATVNVSASPGTNVIRAYAVDNMDNRSPTQSVAFTYLLKAPLVVRSTGAGTLKPNYDGQWLEINKLYSMTATPAAGFLFSHWTDAAWNVVTNTPRVDFLMRSNLVLQANFVPNLFIPLRGSYAGLFHEADQVAHLRSGGVTLKTTPAGGFSGQLQMGGNRSAFRGQFDAAGSATVNVPRNGLSPLTLQLQLDLTGGTERVTGSVSDGNWTAELSADRAVYDGKTTLAPEAGAYTLVLSGADDDVAQPFGHSHATAKITTAGKVKLVGTLADGTKWSQGTTISKHGQWPLYVPLYAGGGGMLSWLTFSDEDQTDLAGAVSWIKPAQPTAKYYPAGFTWETELLGSRYLAPTPGNRVLNLTTGELRLAGGNLPADLTQAISLTSDNKVLNLASNKLTLTFNLAAGTYRGTVLNPDTGRSLAFAGVVQQKLNLGAGCFLGTNQSGRVTLTPVTPITLDPSPSAPPDVGYPLPPPREVPPLPPTRLHPPLLPPPPPN